MQQRRRAAKAHAPDNHAQVDHRGIGRRHAEYERGKGEGGKARQHAGAQVTVNQLPRDPYAGERGRAKYEQDEIDPPAQPGRRHEGGDVGVEDVMGKHPGDHDAQHRADPWRREHLAQRHPFVGGLPGIVRHLGQHPGDQHQRQGGHDPERHAPAYRRPQQGAQRNAQRQRDRGAHHRQRQCASLLIRGDHAPRIARQKAPGQSCGDPGEEPGYQGQPVVCREGRCGIEDQESHNGQQQDIAAAPAARGDRQRDCGQQRAQRVGRYHLPGQRLADIEAIADLRQQARGQRFGHDTDEAGHGERQQPRDGETVGFWPPGLNGRVIHTLVLMTMNSDRDGRQPRRLYARIVA
ncbi:hypothetical protein D3C71_1287320 [compost metagenome]